MKKLLRDEDYWRALDEISGPRWAVFAIRAAPGSWQTPRLPAGVIGMLFNVWKEPKENQYLIDAFELGSTQNLPGLVIFTVDPDGEVHRAVFKVNDQSEILAYESLREVLTTIADALDRMDDAFRREGPRAFETVGYALKNLKQWTMLKNGTAIWRHLRSMLPPG
ncbi:MAG TPA: hypothetical protein VEC57_07535 [Candidatus Limnocylindrales bacterium]|nr:hypothetical protein [Candidatus Limnocylindrales bacterium]